MWVFYHDIASVSGQVPSVTSIFAALTLLTGFIILVPSYFERKK